MIANRFEMSLTHAVTSAVLILLSVVLAAPMQAGTAVQDHASDPRLQKAYRFQQGGWTYVHLEGSPADIGFQHGYLLAPEIQDAFLAIQLYDTYTTKRDWQFFRNAAQHMLWPHIDEEYQQELQGIADGLKAHGVDLDVYDVVALNAFEELPEYYVPWVNKREHAQNAPQLLAPGNCSAFIATGGMTKDHQIVIAHNNWTSYLSGERWVMMFDIVPAHGNRMLMDGFPGVITSDDDFGINSGGLMIMYTIVPTYGNSDVTVAQPTSIGSAIRRRASA